MMVQLIELMKELFGKKRKKKWEKQILSLMFFFSEWDTLYRIWNGCAELKVDVKLIT